MNDYASLILIAVILLWALYYFARLVTIPWRQREAYLAAPGGKLVGPLCVGIFFGQALGFPDYVLGTILYRKLGWVEDENLPGTLLMATIVPGALASVTFLRDGSAALETVLLCTLFEAAGSLLGSRLVQKFNGEQVRKTLGRLLVVAVAAFIVKAILDPAGAHSGLSGWQYAVALPCMFALGVVNMMGVPMKPFSMLLLLLLGLTPTATITVMLTMGVIGPMMGGMQVVRGERYQKRIAFSAATFGLLGACAGSLVALSLNDTVYTVLLILIMLYAAYTLLKK